MGFVRVLAVALAGALLWGTGAGDVSSHLRLSLDSIVPGARVTQPFGCTSLELEPVRLSCPSRHFHSGIDLAAPAGSPVYAAAQGVAEVGSDFAGAGNYVAVIGDGNVRVLYCHLAVFRVRPGDRVQPGQLIGTVGATGLATGPHLHFEVDIDRIPVDPAVWLSS